MTGIEDGKLPKRMAMINELQGQIRGSNDEEHGGDDKDPGPATPGTVADGHAFFTGDYARRVGERACLMHLYGNAIDPTLFPGILELEKEVVSIAAAHLGGDREVVGNFTSGGAESIMLAVKTSRDRARDRRPEFASPEMVIPLSTHAAFFKAAHFLGSNLVPVEVDGDFRADVQAIKESLSNNTVMIAASAPSDAHNGFKLDFKQRKL